MSGFKSVSERPLTKVERFKNLLIVLAIPVAFITGAIALGLLITSITDGHEKRKIEDAYDVKVVKVVENQGVNEIQIRDGGALRQCKIPSDEEVANKTPMTCVLLNPAR